MLASTLRRHIANGAFEDFQQRLLHAFSGNIARNGNVLGLARDLINFININDAALGAFDIVIGVLQQPQNNVFDILAHVTRLRQSRGVGNCEGISALS